MRRPLATLLVAALLALAVPMSVDAARPGPIAITSVAITANGGTWPLCRQIATVSYQTFHRPAHIDVMPSTPEGSGWTGNNYADACGAGTVVIAIEDNDRPISGPAVWDWSTTLSMRARPSGRTTPRPSSSMGSAARRPA